MINEAPMSSLQLNITGFHPHAAPDPLRQVYKPYLNCWSHNLSYIRILRLLFGFDPIRMSNEAVCLTAARVKPFHVAEAPMPAPGPNEIVIRNHATASEQSRLYGDVP